MSKSIPQLTAKTDTESTDLLHIVRSNVDYKITYENLMSDTASRYGNTIFVNSVTGSDITGEVENPAKPFATIAAARAAGNTYYSGATGPSSTNIITMDIRGTFTEALTLVNYYYYNLNDSYLTTAISDSGGSVNCIIYGNGYINATGGTDAINLTNASTLYVKCYIIIGSISTSNSISVIDIDANIISQSSYSVTYVTGGALTIRNASITNSGASMFYMAGAGSVTVVECTCISDNEILKTSAVSSTAVASFRRSRLKTTGTNLDCINLLTNTGTNLTLTINGCTLIANGTGNSIDAAQATNVYVYGRNQVNLTHDTGNVTLLVGTVANYGFVIDAATV